MRTRGGDGFSAGAGRVRVKTPFSVKPVCTKETTPAIRRRS